jgi:hypothetical protein
VGGEMAASTRISSHATMARKLKSCIIKVLMTICPTIPHFKCIFQVKELADIIFSLILGLTPSEVNSFFERI